MGTSAAPMRCLRMVSPTLRFAALAAFALSLAACERKSPEPRAAETAAPAATAVPEAPPPAPSDAEAPRPASRPDLGALDDREDPDRLVRFYADALARRDWSAAARAWGAGSGVTAATLKAAYDRPERPALEAGKGTVEGAAGSLYYEAPVTLRFGDAPPERGTLTLRRVNDVPGASAGQLRWHIERAAIGVGQ